MNSFTVPGPCPAYKAIGQGHHFNPSEAGQPFGHVVPGGRGRNGDADGHKRGQAEKTPQDVHGVNATPHNQVINRAGDKEG
jgi:hypothetical protein